jgi:phosphomethylpyrimidine synthase
MELDGKGFRGIFSFKNPPEPFFYLLTLNERSFKMTQIERAKAGESTAEILKVSRDENVAVEVVRGRVAAGRIIIVANRADGKGKDCGGSGGNGGNGKNSGDNGKGVSDTTGGDRRVVGIGEGLRTKVNASLGTSTDIIDPAMEIEKALTAQKYGADTIMDLSMGGDISGVRRMVMDAVELPVGTVPLYEAFAAAAARYGSIAKMPEEFVWETMERQCEEGVAFMAIHCGINRRTVEVLRRQGYRYGGIVSKGGACMVSWMEHNGRENPLYEHFDRVVSILKKHDVVLSLGNGFRAGAIHDSTDRTQIQELLINCELAEAGRAMGCQTMVEGPGHIPINEIEANVILAKKMSGGAPFYMLGPITTDIAPGYDHITAAVGAALSSSLGADFICSVTPAEHLGLPLADDIRQGVVAARIATHIGDMIKRKDLQVDKAMSIARRDMQWQTQFSLAIDSERAMEIRAERAMESSDGMDGAKEHTCTMCGDFCANDTMRGMFKADMAGTDKESIDMAGIDMAGTDKESTEKESCVGV